MRAMISTDMKQINRKVVFDLARKMRTVTRVELAEKTGMSGPSILAIVNEFLEKGILVAGEKKAGSVGRSPVTMVFNPNVMMSIGVEFEGTHLSAGLVNLDGDIRFHTVTKVPASLKGDFFESLYQCVDQVVTFIEKEGLQYSGIGIGIPGVVNPDEYMIRYAPHLGDAASYNVAQEIAKMGKRYQKPVFLENDVNASAVGEYYVRKLHEDMSDMLYISIGTGIGAGIILNGELRHGGRGTCGEIGYCLRDRSSIVSRDKEGWLEKKLSAQTLCEIFPEYKESGRVTEEMAEYVTEILCPFVANLVNTLDISQVMIGGQLMVNGGSLLLGKLREAVRTLTLSGIEVQGCMSEYTGVVGSALIASDKLWNTIL